MRVGAFETLVHLTAGTTTEVSVRHDRYAELRVRGYGSTRLVALDAAASHWFVIRGATENHYFVAPGSYRLELIPVYRVDSVPLRTVVLQAGMRKEIRIDLPQARLVIGIRYQPGSAPDWKSLPLRVVPLGGGKSIRLRVARPLDPLSQDRVYSVAKYLQPGRYRVEFHQRGWQDATQEVDVEDAGARVTLSLRRS